MELKVPAPQAGQPRVVVIGGGFAGLTMARKLCKKPFQVVLIDRNNFHTFQPLLYQVATGGLEPDSIAYPLRKIFQDYPNITFRMTEVTSVDPSLKIIDTPEGTLKYDYLVIATGSTNNFFGMQELQRHAMPLKSLPEALDLRSLLLQNLEKAITEPLESRAGYLNIIIVGGGPTGVEVAGALGELRRHVLPCDYPELKETDINIYLLEGDKKVLAVMSPQSSEKAEKFLNRLGIKMLMNTRLVSYDGNTATLGNGETISSKTLIWSAGVKGQTVPGIPAEMIDRGRFRVNRFSEIEGLKDVYAVGDVASMIEEKFPKGHPMVAQVAIQQAKRLSDNLLRKSRGKEMLPFSYHDKGSMATVGRNRAVVDLPWIHFQGALAWFAWMAVHLMTLVGFRNRVVVFINWVWNYFSYDRAIRLIIRPFKSRSAE